ncbi:hypothetical protein [Dictyobacter kobayashii]|uniref:hypothetical protein n=1 Tax=Dictyobacter kobayashii TaxID=2014872 RepID=UPI0013867738|nr:hypothetical protein [Dictyobacter kobayashii]
MTPVPGVRHPSTAIRSPGLRLRLLLAHLLRLELLRRLPGLPRAMVTAADIAIKRDRALASCCYPGTEPVAPSAARNVSPAPPPVTPNSSLATSTSNGNREMMAIGEDDLAIFEQMRHQLVIWLRVEAISAGLEITNQSPLSYWKCYASKLVLMRLVCRSFRPY